MEPSSVVVTSSFELKPFETSPTFSKLFEALAKVQGEMKPAVLDMYNPHYNSWYASLSSCKDACQEPMFKHMIACSQPVFWFDGHYYIKTILVHGSEFMASTLKLTLSKSDMQGLGSAITYAKRYALSAAIGIVDTEDDDGNRAIGKEPDKAPYYRETVKIKPKVAPTPKTESPTLSDLLNKERPQRQAPPSRPLDVLMDVVKKNEVPLEAMPGIIKRSIGVAKNRHDLTESEIDLVIKTINLFGGRVSSSSENGRGQVMTDRSAPTSTDEEIQYEL